MTKQKKVEYKLQLNEIKQSTDPTRIDCTFVIFDFERSHNNAVISKKVALESAPSIINKPINVKYFEVEDDDNLDDALGGHEAYIGYNRYGDNEFKTDTTAIGTFTSEGYIMSIDTPNGTKEVMAADATLWRSKYSDAVDLLIEWFERGININTSCEILYSNFSFINGVEYLESPIYLEGHCILNSEKRGEHNVVLPAYESSKLLSFNEINKFNRMVAQAVNQDESKEVENMENEKNPEQVEIPKTDEEIQKEIDKHPTIVPEETVEQPVVEETDEKEEVKPEEQVDENQNLHNEIAELKAQLEALTSQKNEIEEKFNKTVETLTQTNSQVESLLPYKEQVEKEAFAKKLSEQEEYYAAKFKALNAAEKFESEDIQALLKKSVSETTEGKEAILQINSMLVDLVVSQKEETPVEKVVYKEMASKRENLIPDSNDFDSRYSQ